MRIPLYPAGCEIAELPDITLKEWCFVKELMGVLSRIIVPMSIVLALWMGAGRWLFGIGGSLTWWYLPSIGLAYVATHVWVANRIAATRKRGLPTSRAVRVGLIVSWCNAVAFGFTVPDRHGDGLETIISHLLGDGWREMAIALCNPFGIISFVFIGVAIGFAMYDSRGPHPRDDEDVTLPSPQTV